MYINKCIKCGAEFETKNPKRVICPKCLYADKSVDSTDGENKQLQSYSSYSAGEDRPAYDNNRRYNNNYGQGGYQQRPRQDYRNNGGYQQRRNNYQQRDNSQGGGFRKPYNNDNRFQGNRPNNRFQGNNRFQNNKKPGMGRPKKQPKPLLLAKEQLENIEILYKTMLPLPNPDAHELIGGKLGIEPQKVFFGINLIRQKMMLPKLAFPKRKLAITPDQMTAIKSLYEPLLPLPPIGCHKIIAAQLKMDEWRVHVGIKLVRAQLGLERWNEDRADKPADCLVPKHPKPEKVVEEVAIQDTQTEPVTEVVVTESAIEAATEEPAKPKRGRKPKVKNEE